MPNNDFSLNVDTSQVNSFLGGLTARLQGLDPLMNTIGASIDDDICDRFETETDPAGTPWAGLAASTIKQRTRKGLIPIRKLQATGKGRANIRAIALSNAVRVAYGEGGTEYMELHDKGTSKMPQRRFIPTQQEVESGLIGSAISAATEAYLSPGLGKFVRGEIRRLRR